MIYVISFILLIVTVELLIIPIWVYRSLKSSNWKIFMVLNSVGMSVSGLFIVFFLWGKILGLL